MNKLLIAVASLAVVAAPVAASAQSYGHGGGYSRGASGHSYQGGGRGGSYGRGSYGRGYDGGGDALAAGVLGLVVGSALASNQPYGYGPSYGYDEPYGYTQRCEWRTQPYGYGRYRQVQVCR